VCCEAKQAQHIRQLAGCLTLLKEACKTTPAVLQRTPHPHWDVTWVITPSPIHMHAQTFFCPQLQTPFYAKELASLCPACILRQTQIDVVSHVTLTQMRPTRTLTFRQQKHVFLDTQQKRGMRQHLDDMNSQL
jgi:hypothetical protein